MHSTSRSQSGQVLVLVALAILALVAMTALALLAGSAAWQRNQLQSLADSAALDAAMKVGFGCNAASASTVLTEADNFVATQRTRTGSLSIAAGTCATPYHGTDTFGGGLSADYYWPYAAHQQQVEVVLTLTLPISFGAAAGAANTTVSRYAVAQALPASMPAVSATTLSCTSGQVNVAGDIAAQNAVTMSGGCAFYAHQRASSGSYSALGNVRVYTDGQTWTNAGTCTAASNSGSTNAICADGSELSGHSAPACAAASTEYLSAANQAVNANPCGAGVGRTPVASLPSTLPPDPNTDPAAIATLQGTGGAACSAAGVYGNIVAGGTTWGTGQAPVPTKDASGFWHFKPSCYGYLNFGSLAGGTITNRQVGTETAATRRFITPTLPGNSTAGTLLVAELRAADVLTKIDAPAGWVLAVDASLAGEGQDEIWYYQNNPGGIASMTFTVNPGSIDVKAQMTEWNGVATVSALDRTGSNTVSTAGKNASVSTSAAMTSANELVITSIGFGPAGAGNTYTKGAGWTQLINDNPFGHGSEYRTNLGAVTATENVAYTSNTTWSLAMATFKPGAASGGVGAVLDPGFYYFNGSGFVGGGGICLNGGELLARDVTIEFVNQAGLSTGTCAAGGGANCATASCELGSDPAQALVDTNYTWFAAPCSQDPNVSPDVSCLGASSWCPAGDRSCWNLLIWSPASATGQITIKGALAEHWLLGSLFWSGTFTDTVNGTSMIAGSVTCGTLSISAAAGAGTAIGSDYGTSTATVEALLVE